MKMYVKLDSDGYIYILTDTFVGTPDYIEVSLPEGFDEAHLSCYKYSGGKLTLDKDKVATRDKKRVQLDILNERQEALSKFDYMFTTDYPADPIVKDQIARYRQEWRDITKQQAYKDGDRDNIQRPEAPKI